MAPSFRHALIIMALGFLVTPARSDSCLPAVDVDAILLSVDSFLVRQMDRFPVPGDYPTGYEEAQLIQTYDFLESDLPCAPPYWRADIYDSALAAFYFTQRADLNRARRLLDGIRLVQTHDPVGDGRTRTSYHADDLLDSSGQALPDNPITGTGNMAWQGIALAHFFHVTGEQVYLDAAKATADWINDHTRQPVTPDDPFGGFSMGEDGSGNPAGGTTKGRSTEHNVDVYSLSVTLYRLEYDQKWLGMAEHAQMFVQQMFHETEGKYWIGTKENGTTHEIEINYYPVPADTQTWTALAGADSPERATRALLWLTSPTYGMLVEDLVCQDKTCTAPCPEPCDACYCDGATSDCCYDGVRFTSHFAAEHIQSEVTAGAAMALCLDERQLDAQGLLCNVERIRLTAPNHDVDGKGVVATPWCDCADTGLTEFPNERHVASTVWAALAFMVGQGDALANPLESLPGAPIPAVSDWGVLAMALLVLVTGTLVFMRRRPRTA